MAEERINRREFLRKIIKVGAVAGAAAAGIKVWNRASEPKEEEKQQIARGLKFTPDGWATRVEVDRNLISQHRLHFAIRGPDGGSSIEPQWDTENKLIVAYNDRTSVFHSRHPTDKKRAIVTLISHTPEPKVIEVGVTRFMLRHPAVKRRVIFDSKKITHQGIDVYLEPRAPHEESKVREMAEELAILQPVIGRRKVNQIFLTRARTEANEHPLHFTFSPDNEKHTGVILGKADALAMNLHRQITFHEGAHAVYWGNEESKPVKDFRNFAHGYMGFWFNKYREQRRMLMTKQEREREHLELEQNELFSVFDESTYGAGDHRAGHPYSDASELFASCSNVMRHYPAQFMEKIENLKRIRGQGILYYERAIETAFRAAKIYGRHASSIFSSELLGHLQRNKRELDVNW